MGEIRDLVWKDAYNVGVDYIDAAHQKLFSVIRRIMRLTDARQNFNRDKFTCLEAVKFLESYTLEHFAQEEAYQRSVSYPGYEMHKALHDNLREVVLPDLKADLEKKDYSAEAVEQLMAFFAGWLTGHILIEDRAITGRAVSRWGEEHNADRIDVLDHEFCQFMKELFGADTKLADRHFAGEKLNDAIYYNMEYKSESGSIYDVIMFAEKKVILFMVSKMLGKDVSALDSTAFISYIELARTCAHQALNLTEPGGKFTFVSHKALKDYELTERFKAGFPDVSVLWKIKEGALGLCVEKLVKAQTAE